MHLKYKNRESSVAQSSSFLWHCFGISPMQVQSDSWLYSCYWTKAVFYGFYFLICVSNLDKCVLAFERCNFPSDLQVESLSKYSSTSTFLFFSFFFFMYSITSHLWMQLPWSWSVILSTLFNSCAVTARLWDNKKKSPLSGLCSGNLGFFSSHKYCTVSLLVRGPSLLTSPVGSGQLEMFAVVWDSGSFVGALI